MAEAGYSFSLTTFSPSGKLLQIEHALRAVQGGKASLGIQGTPVHKCRSPSVSPHPPAAPTRAATNGVVIATEKKLPSPLVDEESVQKIQLYTGNIGACARENVGRCGTRSALTAAHRSTSPAPAGVIYSGMGPDFRVLVRKGQKKAQQYYLQYGVRAPVAPGSTPSARAQASSCCIPSAALNPPRLFRRRRTFPSSNSSATLRR